MGCAAPAVTTGGDVKVPELEGVLVTVAGGVVVGEPTTVDVADRVVGEEVDGEDAGEEEVDREGLV
ncbi:Uu.00g023820.m01.CDS01 [Anthostomella pinea]|uniref:Uu.00g023820.m01.CDS01 n=1 Tax=Anthostomella pinea TaxID=933095 RepID=A0AAI8W1C1_9PEZI|nr:Uu.00g023820.m01.CDS01 [Anthostomella pinea]